MLNIDNYSGGAEEQEEKVIRDGLKKEDNAVKTDTVDRTQRAVQKSSVDKASFIVAIVNDLQHPSDECIDEKHTVRIQKRIKMHKKNPFVRSFRL